MANVYYGDAWSELTPAANCGPVAGFVSGTASGNQVFTLAGHGMPLTWRGVVTFEQLVSPFQRSYARVSSVSTNTITTVNAPVTAGRTFTARFMAFDWNTVGNWYETLSTTFGCCCLAPGTPLGRLPNASTDSVFITPTFPFGYTPVPSTIWVGPSGGYSGTVGFSNGQAAGLWGYYTFGAIAAGTYSGTVTLPIFGGRDGLSTTPYDTISGGTFTGTVTSTSFTEYDINQYPPRIGGGTFTGTVTQVTNAGYGVGRQKIAITGGTYSPTVDIPYSSFPGSTQTYYPRDPGFAIGGGTFSPTINLTGAPAASDILGAGLP